MFGKAIVGLLLVFSIDVLFPAHPKGISCIELGSLWACVGDPDLTHISTSSAHTYHCYFNDTSLGGCGATSGISDLEVYIQRTSAWTGPVVGAIGAILLGLSCVRGFTCLRRRLQGPHVVHAAVLDSSQVRRQRLMERSRVAMQGVGVK